MEPRLNHLQAYLAQEFVDDYHEGRMTRRELLARVIGITGGVASAATLLLTLGCAPATPPSPAPPGKPSGAAASTPSGTPAGAGPAGTPPPAPTPSQARSKFSVKPDDPDIAASDVTFPGEGTSLMGYLARPKSGGPFPAVLVCHENRGLVEHIRDVTRRLAKAGYVALAVDLLSRDGGTAKVDPAQVPGRLTANPARNVTDFRSAFSYLQTLDFVQGVNVGMVGFCFGGGVTWMVATAIPDLKAAVPYYGPNPPLQDVPKIRAAVLAIYGENDQRINAGIPAIEEAMRQNGKTFERVVYPGANHAFHNDTGANWNEQAAYDAWGRTLAWFERYLV
ncbi:MAG: dienelactone hydrolase family protein [Sphingomonadaceae bacterium]